MSLLADKQDNHYNFPQLHPSVELSVESMPSRWSMLITCFSTFPRKGTRIIAWHALSFLLAFSVIPRSFSNNQENDVFLMIIKEPLYVITYLKTHIRS